MKSKHLEKLVLKHFQIHKNKTIEFASGVTSLVGRSDAGKSVIIRALKWMMLSDWDACYLTFGQTEAFGSLTVDGRTLKRRKGKKINLMRLDSKEFAAFAGTVPDEVTQLLQVTELNFQNQLDAHFWFSDSAGQVSKQLNEIVNLQDIDTLTASVASDLRHAKAEVTVTEERIVQAEKDVNDLVWTIDHEKKVKQLWKINEGIETIRAKHSRIAVLLQTLNSYRVSLNTAKEQCVAALRAATAGERAGTMKAAFSVLDTLLNRLELYRKQVKAVPSFDRIQKAYDKIEAIRLRYDRIDTVLFNLQEHEEELCRLQTELKQSSSAMESFKDLIPTCPTCGTPIRKKS